MNQALPAHWAAVELRSVCERTGTVDPTKDADETFRYVDVSAIDNSICKITGAGDCLGAEAPSRARKAIRRGDVLVATIRPTLKRIAIVPPELDQQVASTAFCVIRARPDVAHGEFLYYAALTEAFTDSLGTLQRGASYPAVSDSDVLDQIIPLPPIGEQRAIAAVLSKLQRAVELEEERVRALQALKAATLAKLFREGLRGERLKQTEIGEIPESWDVVPLGDIVQLSQYGLSTRGEKAGKYPILRMNCQLDGRVSFRDLQFVDLDEGTFNAFALRRGDILFNRTNSIDLVGRTALYDSEAQAVFASYLIRLRINHRSSPRFVNYYFGMPGTQSRLKGLATRAVGQANISASKLQTLLVPITIDNSEQSDIERTLDAITNEVVKRTETRRARMQLFNSTLHLLTTGQKRVDSLMEAR